MEEKSLDKYLWREHMVFMLIFSYFIKWEQQSHNIIEKVKVLEVWIDIVLYQSLVTVSFRFC